MNPGQYNQFVSIERDAGATRDEVGGLIQNWVNVRDCWVRIEPASGREAEAAAQMQGSAIYRVTIRANDAAGVTAKDRINWRGTLLNIRSLPAIPRGGAEIQLLAESGAGI